MPDEAERRQGVTVVERQLLAALCSQALDHKARTAILKGLAAHRFANADHEVIFQAISKMPHASGERIRETLRSRLTRLGFPDIDVEPIFELVPESAEEIEALLRKLNR
jgi:hypothetical protein